MRQMPRARAHKIQHAEKQRTFQQQFRNALHSERAMRSHELSLLLALRAKYVAAQDEVVAANQAYAGLARTREEALFAAHLVDRERYLTTNHQLAQMSETDLSLAQKGIDIESRIARLRRDLRSIDVCYLDGLAMTHAILDRNGGVPALRRLGAAFRAQHARRDYTAAQVERAFHRALGVSFERVVRESRAYTRRTVLETG